MREELVEALSLTGIFEIKNIQETEGFLTLYGSPSADMTQRMIWKGLMRNVLSRAKRTKVEGVDISEYYKVRPKNTVTPSGSTVEDQLVSTWRIIIPDQAQSLFMDECNKVLITMQKSLVMSQGAIPIAQSQLNPEVKGLLEPGERIRIEPVTQKRE